MTLPMWESHCWACGESTGRVASATKPTTAPPPCHCQAEGRAIRWREYVRRAPARDKHFRQSGFSTSDSDFTPHWNSSFGCIVRSLDHMKHLQRTRGATDAVVKGDGAEEHAPRDITRRINRHHDFAEQVASGEDFQTGRGVRVTFTEPGEDE